MTPEGPEHTGHVTVLSMDLDVVELCDIGKPRRLPMEGKSKPVRHVFGGVDTHKDLHVAAGVDDHDR